MTKDEVKSTVARLCAGNPGAINAMMAVVTTSHPDCAGKFLTALDEMGFSGWPIWYAFKDACNGDVASFASRVSSKDPALVAAVNAFAESRGYTERLRAGAT